MAIVDVKVPQLSESVAEATMLTWKKKAGEAVAQDEILIEIETDKVVLEVPAPSAGVLAEIVVGDGGMVVSDQVIAKIDSAAKAAAAKKAADDATKKAADAKAAADVVQEDRQIDEEFRAFVRKLISYMMEDPKTITAGLDMLSIAKAIERIGDHAKNIAEFIIFIVKGADVRHTSVDYIESNVL